jgi:hypothetical protein
MALKEKYVVRLTADDRRQLQRLVSSDKHPARVLTRARILLRADAGTTAPAGRTPKSPKPWSAAIEPSPGSAGGTPKAGWAWPCIASGRPAASTASWTAARRRS